MDVRFIVQSLDSYHYQQVSMAAKQQMGGIISQFKDSRDLF